jgi:hypothetical protein
VRGKWRLVGKELYDLSNDPGQREDILNTGREVRLGSEGLITERAIYADVLIRIWQLHRSGSDPDALRDASSRFLPMINLGKTHLGDLRGYQLYL